MNNSIYTIFSECVEGLEHNTLTVEDCLATYPDYRRAIETPLEMAAHIRSSFHVRLYPTSRIKQAMQRLTSEQRAIITCRFIINLNLAETASILGNKEIDIKMLQYQALEALTSVLWTKQRRYEQ